MIDNTNAKILVKDHYSKGKTKNTNASQLFVINN